MKIVIAHLYYDLLNLYGENGNIKALAKQIEEQGIKVEIKNLSLEDEFNFETYDIVYLGTGTKNNQNLALNHLFKYKKEIKKYIDDNKFLIATGNAYELFGKKIDEDKALNIFPYETQKQSRRKVAESIFKCNLVNEYIIGFQNQESVITNNENNLFEVTKGIANLPNNTHEGYKYNNFYGTYLIGPLFIRNPHFLKYMVKQIITFKYPNFKFKKFNLKLETKAYNKYIDLKYNLDKTVKNK